MNEPLKKEDFVRGVIVNAEEYKSDNIISPGVIESVWVNLEKLESAKEWLKERLSTYPTKEGQTINDILNEIDKAFEIEHRK